MHPSRKNARTHSRMALHTLSLLMLGSLVSPLQVSRADDAPPPAEQRSPARSTTLSEIQVKAERVHADGSGDLTQAPSLGKTGTRLDELPASVQLIQRQVIDDQGGTSLASTIKNASGISAGGTDGFGITDNFLIRGLNARIYNDGFSQGDQRNNIPNSLNGVERIEILEGPGSALFGSGPPGGSINLVHYVPLSTLHFGSGLQVGSFGSIINDYYVTGPVGVDGLDYRLDALAEHADGFRGLHSSDYELRPSFSWAIGQHAFRFTVDARHVQNLPDPPGLIYLNGAPIESVSIKSHYSTPFGYDNQNLVQVSLADAWSVADILTLNNRFSYLHHINHILRNSDGGTVSGQAFTGRQLRMQNDDDDGYDYQLEPVFKFTNGPIKHTLLTGFESQYQTIDTSRATADLPNIANIFNPVVPETSSGQLTFLRDAKHSGAIDQLSATYISVYATDQVDLTEQLKLRAGVRQDWWNTRITPKIFVPGRLQPNGQPFEAGVTTGRRNAPVSWNVGTLYKLSGFSPYIGVSRSSLANFSSEATQNGVAPPETALQYEGGVKMSLLNERITLTTAAFHVRRSNVFSLVGDTPVFNAQATNGVEADFNLQATAQWQIEANATSQHAALIDNPSNPAAAGKQVIGVPAHIANLWTTYAFNLAGIRGFQLAGGVNYRDKIYGNLLNTNHIPGYVTANTSLVYKAVNWDVSLGVKNIADKRYFTAADGAGGLVADPRTLYMQGDVHF